MAADEAAPGVEELAARIRVIERDLDAQRYRPGPWARTVRDLRNSPGGVREKLAADVSRVSRKLHMRNGRRTVSARMGIVLELAATVLGGALLALAFSHRWSLLAIVAMLIWMMTFQPLIKLAVGRAFGVGYDYAFLSGLEPRFKMDFGSYVAAPRWKRIVLHLSGTVGSPLAAILVAMMCRGRMPIASSLCRDAFWILVAVNVIPTVAALVGIDRIGPLRVGEGSGGSAAIELREALGR
jgi:hypothetical protein